MKLRRHKIKGKIKTNYKKSQAEVDDDEAVTNGHQFDVYQFMSE